MLGAVEAADVEELFEQIPADHRLRGGLDLPAGIRSEAALRRHMLDILAKNETCEGNLSFLGGGCWQHYVPAVCDEIVSRTEFVTSIWGTPSSDHGRNQAWFEFASQLGELLELEFVGLPVYSWGCAAGHAIRMAARITGRHQVLVPRWIDPERLAVIRNYCEPPEMAHHIELVLLDAGRKQRSARPRRPRGRALGAQPPRSTSRAPGTSARSRPAPRRSRSWREASARRRSSASTRSRSEFSPRRRPSGPTSWSARPSRSAST